MYAYNAVHRGFFYISEKLKSLFSKPVERPEYVYHTDVGGSPLDFDISPVLKQMGNVIGSFDD